MLRPSPNHGTQRLPDDDELHIATIKVWKFRERIVQNKNLHMFKIGLVIASTDEFSWE